MKALWRIFSHCPVRSTVALIVVLVSALALYNVLTSASDPVTSAIRKQGYPVTLAELDAWYPSVPANENAALVYQRVFTAVLMAGQFSAKLSEKTSIPPRGEGWGPNEAKELKRIVNENARALAQVYALPETARSRYPIELKNGFQTLLPHLSKVKEGVILVSADAILQASEGHMEEAVQALIASGRVADSLSSEPLLISQLVRYACWGIWATRVDRVFNLGKLTDAQLTQIQKMAAGADAPENFARALIGERAVGLSVFSDPAQRNALFGAQPGAQVTLHNLRASLVTAALKGSGILKKDRALYVNVLGKMVRSAELSYPERWKVGAAEAASIGIVTNRLCWFSRQLLPGLARSMVRDADHTAKMRLVLTAAAVERYRRAHGERLPLNLEALVPQYLPAVPGDPYDGAPIRFKKLEPGFIVYSIGSDEADNGGAETSAGKGASTDLTFIVGR